MFNYFLKKIVAFYEKHLYIIIKTFPMVYHSSDIWQFKAEDEASPNIRSPFEDLESAFEVDRYDFKYPPFPRMGDFPVF